MEKKITEIKHKPTRLQVTAITEEVLHTHTHTHTNSFIKSNVPGQPGLYRETLSRKTKTNEQKKKKKKKKTKGHQNLELI